MIKKYVFSASLFFTFASGCSCAAINLTVNSDIETAADENFARSLDGEHPLLSPEEAKDFWNETERAIENADRQKMRKLLPPFLTKDEQLIQQLKRAYVLARRDSELQDKSISPGFTGSFEDYLRIFAPKNPGELRCNFFHRIRRANKSLRKKLSSLATSKPQHNGLYASKLEQAPKTNTRRPS